MRKYHKRYLPFEEKFIAFSDRIEKFLVKIVIIFLIMLVSAQFLISFDQLREIFVPLESIEGTTGFYNFKKLLVFKN